MNGNLASLVLKPWKIIIDITIKFIFAIITGMGKPSKCVIRCTIPQGGSTTSPPTNATPPSVATPAPSGLTIEQMFQQFMSSNQSQTKAFMTYMMSQVQTKTEKPTIPTWDGDDATFPVFHKCMKVFFEHDYFHLISNFTTTLPGMEVQSLFP